MQKMRPKLNKNLIKNLSSFLLAVPLIGCITYRDIPIADGLPNLQFEYWNGTDYIKANGQAASHVKENDAAKFKIKIGKHRGDCRLRYLDGNRDLVTNCTGKSEIEIDLGKYYTGHPEVVSFLLIEEKYGIKSGYFYPSMRPIRDVLPVVFQCPVQETKDGLSVCTRPAGFKFMFKVVITQLSELLYTYQCRGEARRETLLKVAKDTELSLDAEHPTYCTVGLGLKAGSFKQNHVLHVRFYDAVRSPVVGAAGG